MSSKPLPTHLSNYQLGSIHELLDIVSQKQREDFGHINFEELAFIDFMIGKNAMQVYGHKNSSFSVLLNAAHNSNNYY